MRPAAFSIPLLRRFALLVLLVLARPPALRAQASAAAVCPQGRISSVFIDNHSVFDLSDPDRSERFDWAYRLANRLHVPTRESVVQRELLFGPGDCYDPQWLRESERLLRSVGFIADVDIFGVQQADSSVHVIVDTRDEWSLRIEPRISSEGGGLAGLRVREDNLLGTGNHLSGFYFEEEERQVYGFTYHTPQLLRSRWNATLEAGRTPVGVRFHEALTYPFLGITGRWALHQSVLRSDHYFEYLMPYGDRLLPVWYPERRESLDLAVVYSWGGRGYNRTLLGAALAGERVRYPEGVRFGDDVPVPEEALPRIPRLPADSLSSVRIMLLTGQRNVYYVRRRALDTVQGTEDVRLGVETEIVVGPSLGFLSYGRDLAAEVALSAGAELPGGVLTGGSLVLEGRRDYDAPGDESEWQNVFGQLDVWSYWRTSPESPTVWVAALSGVGGWHTTVPFQLTLGGEAGLRGYPDHLVPGARRLVASLESRRYLRWPAPDLVDLGVVAFADVGRIWAGEAPFGVDDSARASAGLGLRGAFPPGSRLTWRLDVGVPLRSDLGFGDVVVTVGMGQLIGHLGVRRDQELERSTRPGVSTSDLVLPTLRR